MAFWAALGIFGFALLVISVIGMFLWMILEAIGFLFKKKKNPLRSYIGRLIFLYFIGLTLLFVGALNANITKDPTGYLVLYYIYSLIQGNIDYAIAGFGAFAIYIYRKVDDLFNLLQDPKTGIHHRLDGIEKDIGNINSTLTRIDTKIDKHIDGKS